MFCILVAIFNVRSAVEPPAPQVISQKVGLSAAILSCLSNKFSTPCILYQSGTATLLNKVLIHASTRQQEQEHVPRTGDLSPDSE